MVDLFELVASVVVCATGNMRSVAKKAGQIVLGIAFLGITPVHPSKAHLPDEETYNFVVKRYTLFVDSTRDGCNRYIRPADVYKIGPIRYAIALKLRTNHEATGGNEGGTMCNGVFEFLSLRVDCDRSLISFNPKTASIPNYKEQDESEINSVLARKICMLPAKE